MRSAGKLGIQKLSSLQDLTQETLENWRVGSNSMKDNTLISKGYDWFLQLLIDVIASERLVITDA